MKKSVVIGASENPDRYAYKATMALQNHQHEVIPVGLREGNINGIPILKDQPKIEHVDTVTLYVGPQNQQAWMDYVLSLNPKRVIFNPGTENDDFENKLKGNNIEVVQGCTLVMLSIGNY
ncbi:MAG: CoA-binding protein [Bacteroidota bacterium]|nr:CoA-binding protein [Bacteroidota bacterium]